MLKLHTTYIPLLLIAGCAGGPRPAFEDRFDRRPAEGWRWLRENPGGWRVKEGALEIRLEPGDANSVKNALVRPAPDRSRGSYAVEATLTSLSEPTEQYEQAGITWYGGGKPVFKFVHERVDGAWVMIPGKHPMENRTVQLRVEVSADRWVARFRPDARGDWRTAGEGKLPPPGGDEISLQGYHGPADAEHWVRFDDFRITEQGAR